MKSIWKGASDDLSDYGKEIVSFSIISWNVDADEHMTIEDNDQRMFKIKVVEDTDYGGDVPDVKADAL